MPLVLNLNSTVVSPSALSGVNCAEDVTFFPSTVTGSPVFWFISVPERV